MLERLVVAAIRRRVSRGGAIKSVTRRFGVSRNTVRRYLRLPVSAGVQTRPAARRLNDQLRDEARKLFIGSANGNAVLVHRTLCERGVVASIRTVRRIVADRRGPLNELSAANRVDADRTGEESLEWELALARSIARRMSRTDPDELESVLTAHLASLQERRSPKIRSWKAYLITALRRKASNWLRDEGLRIERTVSMDSPECPVPDDETLTITPEPSEELWFRQRQKVLAVALSQLRPEDQKAWRALKRARGNQSRAARYLGIHRNTLRKRLRRIHQVFRRHGLELEHVQ